MHCNWGRLMISEAIRENLKIATIYDKGLMHEGH